MSILADEMAFGLCALIADQGRIVTLRKVTTVAGANPAPNPPTYDGLVVDGDYTDGISTINMQGNPFVGRLIVGDTFTIGDGITEYVVNAIVASSITTNELTGVTFAPPLAVEILDGDTVTFVSFAAECSFPAAVTGMPARLYPAETVQFAEHKMRCLNADLPDGVEPAIGDQVLWDSDVANIVSADHLEMQGVHYGWSFTVRA